MLSGCSYFAWIELLPGALGSTALERVAIARLHGGANALAHGDGVGRIALQEAAKDGELRAQHVSLEHGGEHAASADLDAIGGVV
jgi:hypothetical protein